MMNRLVTALLGGLLAACALIAPEPARAQTTTTAINLSWVLPSTNTDGTTITGTLAVNVFQGTKGGTFTQVGTGLTGTTTVIASATAGNCFELIVAETLSGNVTDSQPSNIVCAEVPNGPTSITLTWSVTVK